MYSLYHSVKYQLFLMKTLLFVFIYGLMCAQVYLRMVCLYEVYKSMCIGMPEDKLGCISSWGICLNLLDQIFNISGTHLLSLAIALRIFPILTSLHWDENSQQHSKLLILSQNIIVFLPSLFSLKTPNTCISPSLLSFNVSLL